MELILIAAMAANRVIGRGNTIPWDIPGEQTRFKETTMGHSLLMGRKTWESLGQPLPGRQNIVVTRNSAFQAPGAKVVHSLEQGLALTAGAERVFVIGGAQLYQLALERADTLILTELGQEVAGDVFFPAFSCPPFALIQTEEVTEPVPYRICTYQRRKGREQA
ncbi:MAG: dihydrofolate reductase [Candidatus Electrothrix sp. GW3-4]|uniref:dihydrofolate reductase n=1 Tax=Candidatus Electrothrix sp. GW3-4 TaxID=3126740 RepID=UPI0030D5AAED